MQSNPLRKKLLLGTVALMAGVGLASAQGLQEKPGGAGNAPEPGISSGAKKSPASSGSSAAKSGNEIQTRGKSETRGERAVQQRAGSDGRQSIDRGPAQRSLNDKDQGKGQAKSERGEKSTTGQGSADKDDLKAKSQGPASKPEKSTNGQSAGDKNGMANKSQGAAKKGDSATTGQGSAGQRDDKATTGQGSPASSQKSTTQQNQTPQMKQQPAQSQDPNASKQNQTSGSASQGQNTTQQQGASDATQQSGAAQSGATIRSQAGTQISAQQQTTIRQSVLSASNAPRVDRVNFSVRTGTMVPRDVRVVSVSTFPVLIETFPHYRDYRFFIVEEEIVFVDSGYRIVDVVPVGPRARFSGGSATTSTTAVVDLSEPEIRILQEVLIERGFLRGRMDGVFGPETREALITFQRKEGIQATGSIDTRTVTALGLSERIGPNAQGRAGSQSSTTGQSESGMQQPSAQSNGGQTPAAQQKSSGQSAPQNQSATGQGQDGAQQPSAQQNKSGQSPSTSGQGSSQRSGSAQPGMNNQDSGSAPSTSGQGNMQPPAQSGQNQQSPNR